MMNRIGKWKNEYGSVLDIQKQDQNILQGTFESAVDETTKGQKLAVVGVCKDNLIAISCAGGNHVVTYAGMFVKNKLETAWHVVTDVIITSKNEGHVARKRPLLWWESVKTNVDTFERV